MQKDAKIYVAGHRGLVGSAIVRRLEADGYTNLITRTSQELNLLHQKDAEVFFDSERPDYVFLAAAKVGGIHANNTFPAEFIYENLQIQNNVVHHAYTHGVKRLLFLGSSCIYPKHAPQPMKETHLLTGPLEPTNEPYAVAKIAGVKMCQAYNRQYGTTYIPVMPTNLYGPGDNFDLATSHALPAMLRKFYEAKRDGKKEVVIWGSGNVRREWLFVDDLAEAVVHLMNHPEPSDLINIGVGEDITINELAETIKKIIGFDGVIQHDTTKPEGTPQKLLDVSRIHGLGWKAKTSLEDGIAKTLAWFESNLEQCLKNS